MTVSFNKEMQSRPAKAYTNNNTIPSVNDHITVTGPYVLDTDHYNWAEVHPVYKLTIG